MAEHNQSTPANSGDQAGASLTALVGPGQTISLGLKVAAIGVLVAVGSYLLLGQVTNATFPFARFVAVLVFFAAVAGLVAFVRGLVWVLQGVTARARGTR